MPYHLLLTKLCAFGFDLNFLNLILIVDVKALRWIVFLIDVMNGTLGLPQGGVLGTLFFFLFTNDLPKNIVHSVYFLYCDNLKQHSSLSLGNVQCDIYTLSEWAQVNGLSF